ncbi:hypothetical protein WJX73_008151 [Symbiochloris irregularis]|uniref:Uncharacterized protein n=1 Tax=Symbiochloris irregularis TaxID=706552 RepID=A0AAW1P9G4_9CHLO
MQAASAPDGEEAIHRRRAWHFQPARKNPLQSLGEKVASLRSDILSGQATGEDYLNKQELAVSLDLAALLIQQRRNEALCEATRREQSSYKAQKLQLESEIEKAQRDIEQAKQDLAAAQLVRKQNEEYEALRQQVMLHPKRSETQAASNEVDNEMTAIVADDKAAATTIQWRRKQFTVLMHFIRDIKLAMDEDADDGLAPMDAMQA